MKIENIILFFSLIISELCFNQTITFDKTYPASESYFVLPLSDNSSLTFSSFVNGESSIIKVDQFGWIDWQKDYKDFIFDKYSNVAVEYDSSYFVVADYTTTDSTIALMRIDKSGNLIWQKVIGNEAQPYGMPSISITNQGNILIASLAESGLNYNPILLTELTVDGTIVDIKSVYNYFVLKSPRLVKLNDGDFLINRTTENATELVKISSDGEIRWSISFVGLLSPSGRAAMSDGFILASSNAILYKIDLSGGIVWEKNIDKTGSSFVQVDDGSYLVLLDYYSDVDKVIKVDKDGNLIWEKPIYGYGNYLARCIDGGLIFCGRTDSPPGLPWNSYIPENLRLLKTDQDLFYKAINLFTPPDNSLVYSSTNIVISWNHQDVELVDIYYSLDHGKNWESLAKNYPANYDTLSWQVPLFTSDSLIINIVDSNNPDIYDQTDPDISAIVYQPTDYISTNEIFMWIGNNGMGSHDPRTDGSGFYWPGGDSATISAIFEDGLVWGGKVNGEIRVNGNTYRQGLQPGKILEDGTADNPLSTQSKIFKIRKDWQSLPEGNLKDRLEYDYDHWPIEAGAPWDDVNEDGVYTPGFDKPKFNGDETLFYVANDLDTATSRFAYGSDPIGLEFQTTVFGFSREDLKDVVFKKYRVINKSNSDIEDMYFTYFADVDLGFAGDDYEGFDSSYNMAYCFNGDNDDEYFYGSAPPAVGHMIVQGPIIPTTDSDSARYGDGWKAGFKNLGLTSSGMIVKSSSIYPTDVSEGVYSGSLEFYNVMQGLRNDGVYVTNPITGEPTILPLSGDPVEGTGWYEGDGTPMGSVPGDRRYHVPTGPFNLAAGDTQEIVIAIPIARGMDNINSITKLRELAAHVQEFYNTELVDILNTKETIAPSGYTLFQNYPNPFNPKTTIEYEVPEKSNVTIKIYDILGREVKTLVDNEEKVRWKYKVEFDATNIASGVYFYRMQVNPVSGAGGFTETKKMVVLK
ncbi:MAG: T9SS type A sorting domain-containing protein [Ignavibacteriales bacterium]|nr:T9SS type A sorting domain-containing protein [Ignavibacteriales bacterium]